MVRLKLEERQFTQADVLSILPQLSSKTLQNWKTRNVIEVTNGGTGKGNRHLYTGHGVVMLSFMEKAVGRLRIDPKEAASLAPRVAQCAQQLWDLEIDEVTDMGMREIPPITSITNSEYRRGFIYSDDNSCLRMELGRKDRTGSFTPRMYSVVAIDLVNLSVLNLINRHLSGLPSAEVHISRSFEANGPEIDERNRIILAKLASLPVDGWDSDA